MSIRLWHISDSHSFHDQYKVPDNIDIVLHSGDATNSKVPYINKQELLPFLDWYAALPIRHKIFCAGNHEVSLEKRDVTPGYIHSLGITYLENSYTEVMGLGIFGSPCTPRFKDGWAFNRDRSKLHKVWDKVVNGTDIIISHGPPKGVLDLSTNRDNVFEQCGDSNLMKCIERVKPKLVLFGHIHNNKVCSNSGYVKLAGMDTIFSNAAGVQDGKREYGLINNGNVFEIN